MTPGHSFPYKAIPTGPTSKKNNRNNVFSLWLLHVHPHCFVVSAVIISTDVTDHYRFFYNCCAVFHDMQGDSVHAQSGARFLESITLSSVFWKGAVKGSGWHFQISCMFSSLLFFWLGTIATHALMHEYAWGAVALGLLNLEDESTLCIRRCQVIDVIGKPLIKWK